MPQHSPMFSASDIIRAASVTTAATLTLRYWGGSPRVLNPECLIPGGVALFSDRLHASLPDSVQRALDSLATTAAPAADVLVLIAGALSYEAAADVLALGDVADIGAWRRMAVGAAAALVGLWVGRRLGAMWEAQSGRSQ